MTLTFILKNREEKNLGEIFYSEDGFKVNIFPVKEKKKIKDLLNEFYQEGIRDLGVIILNEPIKPDDPLFLNEVRNQLVRRGYILIKKSDKKIFI